MKPVRLGKCSATSHGCAVPGKIESRKQRNHGWLRYSRRAIFIVSGHRNSTCSLLIFWLICWATVVSAQQRANVQSPEISSGLGNAANFLKTYASFIGQSETANRKIRLLWVGCGTEDGAFAASKAFAEFLREHNIKHTFRETCGAHTWSVWRRYLREIAPLLFQ